MKITRMLFVLIYCLFCPLFFLPGVFAQTEKGTTLLGGNANMSFSSQQNYKHFSSSLSPQVGFFIANKLALGTNVSFAYTSYNINSSKYISAGIGPFIRYYITNGRIVPFLEAKGGLSRYRYKYEESTGTERIEKQNSAYGNIGLGLAYFITPSVGLESILSYNINRLNSYNSRSLSLNIGFQIYFSRNRDPE